MSVTYNSSFDVRRDGELNDRDRWSRSPTLESRQAHVNPCHRKVFKTPLTLPYITHDATPYGIRTNPDAVFGSMFHRQAACVYRPGSVFREYLQCIGRRIGIEEPVYDRLWLVDYFGETHVRQP